MIPKKIHYCWFGGNEIPKKDQACIDSWKKMCPDYEIVRWDETNYDVTKNEYMKQAYEAKKWGFVPDYARLDIIYENGGIYLDTDVELIKSLDDLLECRAFMGFEDGKHVSPGLCIGAEKNHETIGKLREIYMNRDFITDDGEYDMTPSPVMNTEELLGMGLEQNNCKQIVAGITIFPKDYFCPKDYYSGKMEKTENTYSIHWFNASWQTPHKKRMLRVKRLIGTKNYDMLLKLRDNLLKRNR